MPVTEVADRTRLPALSGFLTATFCMVVAENLPSGVLPLLADDLGVSTSLAGLLVSGYGLTVAAASVPLTRAVRDTSRRQLLTSVLVLFVVATLGSALAPSYPLMLAGRVVSALAHAVFWAVAVVTVTGLYPSDVRGRVVSYVFGASSVATVVGVPVGAWVGVHAGWRVPFLAVAVLGTASAMLLFLSLPDTSPQDAPAAYSPTPDLARYVVLLVSTLFTVSGLALATTYSVAFLTDVTGFSGDAVGPVLFVRGAAGILGLSLGAALLDRRPRAAMVTASWALGLSTLGLYWRSDDRVAVVVLSGLFGAAMMSIISAMSNEVLRVAPGRTETAAALHSAVFNVSVALGAFVGAILLPDRGLRATVLVAAVLALVGAGILTSGSRPERGPRSGPGAAHARAPGHRGGRSSAPARQSG